MKHLLWCSGNTLLNDDIVGADNCYLFDSKGNKYVDMTSGEWAAPLGHNHPEIVQTIKEQTEKIIHNGFSYLTPIVDEAAKKILDILDFNKGKCVFLNSGSEAVELGAKIVKAIVKKPLFLVLEGSYLGAYGHVGQRRNDEWYNFDFNKCSGCCFDDGCDSECEILKAIPFDKMAGFIFEPGSYSGRVSFPHKCCIQTITQQIKKNGGLVVVNEITTGIGRTGKWFGFEHYDIQPDIVAMGKGIGNGFPVSAVALTQNTFERLEKCDFKHSQSHQNDPLGAAVALEVLRTIQEKKLIERGNRIGTAFMHELQSIAEQYSFIKEIRGRGMMIAIEFVGSEDDELGLFVFNKLFESGYFVNKRPHLNILRIDMPLTIPEIEVKNFLTCFNRIFNEISVLDIMQLNVTQTN